MVRKLKSDATVTEVATSMRTAIDMQALRPMIALPEESIPEGWVQCIIYNPPETKKIDDEKVMDLTINGKRRTLQCFKLIAVSSDEYEALKNIGAVR